MQVLDGEPWYDSPPKGKASTKTAKESADKNREYREKRRQQQQSSGGGSSGGGGSKEDAAKEEVRPIAHILEWDLWVEPAGCPLLHSHTWDGREIYAILEQVDLSMFGVEPQKQSCKALQSSPRS